MMFVYIFIALCLRYTCGNATWPQDVLSVLWDEEEEEALRRMAEGKNANLVNKNALVRKLSQLPFTSELKTDAWYKLLQGRRVEDITTNEWETFQSLIPYLPPDLFLNVNFSNRRVVEFFGAQQLRQSQLSMLAESLWGKLGVKILNDEDEILRLGNIFCGFSPDDLTKINITVFRVLLHKNFFNSIKGCDVEHLNVLAGLAQKYTVLGPPRTWEPDTVKKIGNLVVGLSAKELKEIRARSFGFINKEVIDVAPVPILKEITVEQLKALNKSTLLAWRRKTQDLRPLALSESTWTFPFRIYTVLFITAILHHAAKFYPRGFRNGSRMAFQTDDEQEDAK